MGLLQGTERRQKSQKRAEEAENNFHRGFTFSMKRVKTQRVDFREPKVSKHAQMTAWKRRWSRDQKVQSRERYTRHGNRAGVTSLDHLLTMVYHLQLAASSSCTPHRNIFFTPILCKQHHIPSQAISLSFLLDCFHDKSPAAHATQSDDHLRRHN